MLFGIFAAISQHERELISARTKAGLEQAKKNGVKLGRNTFGDSYIKANDARRDAAEKHRAPVVEILKDSRQNGESYKSIAAKLDRYNMRTATGKPYTDIMLRRMMNEHVKHVVEA
jgi:DNA invertase Pin-like site-specific DNA recombinase